METKHYGGYLMIKETFIQKLNGPYWIRNSCFKHLVLCDNEINDMTFYNYKIVNRSTLPLSDVYFGQWVDPDLGYYLDDYVGCDEFRIGYLL